MSLKIDWSILEDKYQYAAMYSDGEIVVFENKPEFVKSGGYWSANDGMCESYVQNDMSARESLTVRP